MKITFPKIIWFGRDTVEFLDQRSLPAQEDIFTAKSVEKVSYAIREMVIRGARPSVSPVSMAWPWR